MVFHCTHIARIFWRRDPGALNPWSWISPPLGPPLSPPSPSYANPLGPETQINRGLRRFTELRNGIIGLADKLIDIFFLDYRKKHAKISND